MALTESETMKGDFAWIPKLYTAILLQACRDLQGSCTKKRRDVQRRVLDSGEVKEYIYDRFNTSERYQETREWFLSKRDDPFDLDTVCQVVGISKERILERLSGWICPALQHTRQPYIPGEWRGIMRDHV